MSILMRLIAGKSTLRFPVVSSVLFTVHVHSIAATPPFPGLRHFHDGRRYKQWTGDDSKGLMKVRCCDVCEDM